MEQQPKNLRQRWTPGMVVEIDLMDGTYTYGQVASATSIRFFNVLRKESENRPSIEEIMGSPILFEIGVYASALKDWIRVGKAPIDPDYKRPKRYVIDSETGEITIWKNEGGTIPGTREDIEGLEKFAVWDSASVEQRLRDHFAGRPNWHVEIFKTKLGDPFPSIKEFYAKYGYNFHWLDKDDENP